ncbi:MAG: H-NS histone family protein [Zoogloeaceae bacterium]|nr:H-NS histone family protein [Rhodocyclaceae bacterium]MCP5234859.1 H-NS histone family protein [Zoogloeaceae bacterium]
MPELSDLPVDQLRQLAKRVSREIETRGKRDQLRRKFEAMARSRGLSLQDVLGAADPAQLARRPRRRAAGTARPVVHVAPKYVHPSNRALRWSGRGRTPAWVKLWASTGGSMSALENAAEKLAGKGL